MISAINEKVLVQLRGQVVGPWPVRDLRKLPGFTLQTLVSYPGTDKWAPAFRVLNLPEYFDTPRIHFPTAGTFHPSPSTQPVLPAMDFGASPSKRSAIDRWLLRLTVFNAMLACVGVLAWKTPFTQTLLRREFQSEAAAFRSKLLTLQVPRLNLSIHWHGTFFGSAWEFSWKPVAAHRKTS